MSTPVTMPIYQAQGILTLLSRAWNLLKLNLGDSLKIVAAPTLLSLVIQLLFTFISSGNFLTPVSAQTLGLKILFFVLASLLLIPLLILWSFSYCLLARYYYMSIIQEKPPTLNDCLRQIIRIGWPLAVLIVVSGLLIIGISVLVAIVIYVGFILIGFIGAVAAASHVMASQIMMMAFIVLLGFLALIVTIALLSVQAFLFSFPVLALINTPVESRGKLKISWRILLGQAYKLLFKNFFRVICFTVGLMIFNWILMGVLMVPASTWIAIEFAKEGAANLQHLPIYPQLIWNIWSNFANMLAIPYYVCAITLFWYDCQVRTQGKDITLWLERLNHQG